MKRNMLIMMALLLMVAGVNAQKIDQRRHGSDLLHNMHE